MRTQLQKAAEALFFLREISDKVAWIQRHALLEDVAKYEHELESINERIGEIEFNLKG